MEKAYAVLKKFSLSGYATSLKVPFHIIFRGHGNWGELCYGLQANFLKNCGQLMDNYRISRRDLRQNGAIFNLDFQSSPP